MTFKFGVRSKDCLDHMHPDLIKLCNSVLNLQLFDFGISEGYRDEYVQNRLFLEGRTQVKWPNSRHNKSPAEAFDFIVYIDGKVDWDDTNSWCMCAGVFLASAAILNIPIISGSDWDGDFAAKDQNFHDLGHIQLDT